MYAHGQVGKLNWQMFMLLETLTVPIMGPILTYKIVTCPVSHMFHRFSVSGLLCLNLYWYYLFLGKFFKPTKTTSSATPNPASTNSTTTLQKQKSL